MEGNMSKEKKAKWIYWAVTAPFVVTMIMAGFALLAGAAANVQGITHLGYPAYVCKILGTAKVLGGGGILFGRFRTVKEWACAGYTFNLIGALASQAFSGDGARKILVPVILVTFVLASQRLWKYLLAPQEN
jgi:hypothetical protein